MYEYLSFRRFSAWFSCSSRCILLTLLKYPVPVWIKMHFLVKTFQSSLSELLSQSLSAPLSPSLSLWMPGRLETIVSKAFSIATAMSPSGFALAGFGPIPAKQKVKIYLLIYLVFSVMVLAWEHWLEVQEEVLVVELVMILEYFFHQACHCQGVWALGGEEMKAEEEKLFPCVPQTPGVGRAEVCLGLERRIVTGSLSSASNPSSSHVLMCWTRRTCTPPWCPPPPSPSSRWPPQPWQGRYPPSCRPWEGKGVSTTLLWFEIIWKGPSLPISVSIRSFLRHFYYRLPWEGGGRGGQSWPQQCAFARRYSFSCQHHAQGFVELIKIFQEKQIYFTALPPMSVFSILGFVFWGHLTLTPFFPSY